MAARLQCENSWATLRIKFAFFQNTNSFHVLQLMYLMACDVAIGLIYGDFIFDDVLYVVKIVANFLQGTVGT